MVRIGGVCLVWAHCYSRGMVVLDACVSHVSPRREGISGNEFCDFSRVKIDTTQLLRNKMGTCKIMGWCYYDSCVTDGCLAQKAVEAEREACAKLCEEVADDLITAMRKEGETDDEVMTSLVASVRVCAEEIRGGYSKKFNPHNAAIDAAMRKDKP